LILSEDKFFAVISKYTFIKKYFVTIILIKKKKLKHNTYLSLLQISIL